MMRRSMWRLAAKVPAGRVLICLAFGTLAGCASIGPTKLVDTHQGYNDAVQLAESREMLLNIVRLRFGDPIQFLEVTQINSSFSVGATASGSAANVGGAGAAVGSLGGSVSYSDSPTLTFTPRSDQQFARDILLPVHLHDVISFTNRGGAYDSAFFALLTSGINEAPDIPGPNGELYLQRLRALRALIEENHAWITHGKKWVPKSNVPIAVEEITAFDHVWATNNGFQWTDAEAFLGESGRGKAIMVLEYHTPLLVLKDPSDPQTEEYVRLLGLEPGLREYIIRAATDEIALGRSLNFIYVGFRSLKEIMGIVSEYVDVPAELSDTVPQPRYRRTGENKLPFRVRSSEREPRDTAYKVLVHDHWFWIDESDVDSKSVLEALYAILLRQSGASEVGAPTLTLPVGPQSN